MAVGRKRRVRTTLERGKQSAVDDIPGLRRAGATGQHPLPVRRELHMSHSAGMAFQRNQHLPGGGIPDPRRAVVATCDYPLAIGRKHRRPDRTSVARKNDRPNPPGWHLSWLLA